MNNLRDIHNFLDKHEWVDMVFLGHKNSGTKEFKAEYVICNCKCGSWSHRVMGDTSSIMEISQTTDLYAVNAILEALKRNQKIMFKFKRFLNSIKFNMRPTTASIGGYWTARLLSGISRLPVNRGVKETGKK